MVLATLFVLMLRPMARRIRVLREQAVVMAAEDAAARAGTEEHDRQLIHLDQAARPILQRVATGHEFTDAEVTHARLVEADLRDGLRAQGWHLPRVRDAVWRARERGLSVVLLDDSVHRNTSIAHTDLKDVLVGLLDNTPTGRVTARVGPPGRARSPPSWSIPTASWNATTAQQMARCRWWSRSRGSGHSRGLALMQLTTTRQPRRPADWPERPDPHGNRHRFWQGCVRRGALPSSH